MAHKFKLRQSVRLTQSASTHAGSHAAGSWEVVRILPEDQTGEPHYRIKAGDVERAVRESDLEAS